MRPFYKDTKENLEIFSKKSSHIPPHLHTAMECVLVTKGTLEIGVGQELYHMETGDFAIVFQDLIHHYQVFDSGMCRGIYLLASPALSGAFLPTLQQFCPKQPVIESGKLHPDVAYAMQSLLQSSGKEDPVIEQAFVQIILARCIPQYEMVEKSVVGSGDIIYQTVSYIAGHFTEDVSLTGMARELGYSPYALSRVFSGTFHMNFNQYLNEMRLDYVCSILKYSDQTITEAYENAGFQSQRTFNRAFRERYGISPREWRERYRE